MSKKVAAVVYEHYKDWGTDSLVVCLDCLTPEEKEELDRAEIRHPDLKWYFTEEDIAKIVSDMPAIDIFGKPTAELKEETNSCDRCGKRLIGLDSVVKE